jgi:hypothetical protein
MQDALVEAGNGVAVSDVLEGRDEGQLSEMLLTQALQGRSDVVGIYNAGAANLAVERAIKRYTLRLVCRPSLASRALAFWESIAVPDIRLKAASLVRGSPSKRT